LTDELDLHSDEKSAPRLLIVSQDGSYMAYVIANTVAIPVSPDAMPGIKGGMCQLLLHLLACMGSDISTVVPGSGLLPETSSS